jgi:hypothetical protein
MTAAGNGANVRHERKASHETIAMIAARSNAMVAIGDDVRGWTRHAPAARRCGFIQPHPSDLLMAQ